MPTDLPFAPDDRFALLLDATAAGYWEWSTDGSLPVVSPLVLRIYGIEAPSDAPILDRIRACADPEDLASLDAMAVASRESHSPFFGRLRIRRESDGEARVTRVLGRSFQHESGVRRVLGTVIDVTEEHAILDSLHEVRRQLEDAEQLAGLGSWSWNIATGAVQWSKETFRILHVPVDTPPSFELVLAMSRDEAHRQEFLHHVEATLTTGAPYDFEIDAKRPDGTLVRIHTRGAVERDASGSPIRMVGTMQDVTEIRAAQRALEERESRFRTLAESSPMGILLSDADAVPTYANRRLLQWLGLSAGELSAGRWRERLHPDDVHRVVRKIRDHVHPARAFEDEFRLVFNGQVRWLKVQTDVLRNADGAAAGFVGSLLDTSAERFAAEERERLQAQLQQAQKLESLGLLAGGVAHDFNNMLVSILANASMAREDVPPTSDTAALLADIEHAAQRAAELTRQLLEYGGRARIERRRVDVAVLARELPSLLRARIPAGVSFEVYGSPEAGYVHGDETQLRQVLMNLVTNAVDAIGQEAGRVSIDVAHEYVPVDALARCLLGSERDAGEYVVVTVTDSGHGIRADVIERMFDPFFTTKPSGRGLGLAATLGILNSHAGAIEVQSASGQGTRMRVLLPRSIEPSRAVVSSPEEHAPWGGQGTILLVDDDAAVRAAARRSLLRAGFDVTEAEDGVHALEIFDALQGVVTCVVLDVAMPRMTGDACLQALRQRNPRLPVLLSTGFDAADVVQDIVERGDAGFLQKPYTSRGLLQAVRETMLLSARAAASPTSR